MLTPEQADEVIAPPGSLLVERERMEKSAGGLFLPDNYKKYTLASSAIVRAVGYGVRGFRKGERVLLSSTVGKPIEFGMYAERTLWKVPPGAVMAVLSDAGEADHLGAHPARSLSDEQLAGHVDPRVTEGDSLGLR